MQTTMTTTRAQPLDPQAPTEPATLCGEHRRQLLAILASLEQQGYDFVAPTPSTHRRVITRPGRQLAGNLVDVLGWSLPVMPGLLDRAMETALVDAGLLGPREDGLLEPQMRASRVRGQLFLHSAYPTTAADAVFLGPDSLRFSHLITAAMPGRVDSILDYGAGAGVGGIIAALERPGTQLTIADINPKALFLASINAEHAGVDHRVLHVGAPEEIDQATDLMVTHPPFMIDSQQRTYRDGGDLHGARLSLDWALAGARLLPPGGRFVMHTGVAIVQGRDGLHEALARELPNGCTLTYYEMDSDIFGDELETAQYAEVDRIAAVAVIIDRDAA